MATTAQAPATPTSDPVERWLARRSACPQLDVNQLGARMIGSPAPSLPPTYSKAPATYSKAERARGSSAAEECRAATNRANSMHSTGPRTEAGKQRSSLNALGHGLTARTAVLPSEDPEAYQRHIQQFLDEYSPATPTETQLVHEIANTSWRLNRIPFLEAELLSRATNPPTEQAAIDFDIVDAHRALATLGLHGSRLSRQFQKAVEQLRDIQEERRRLERRQLNEAAELFIRHQRKGLTWNPTDAGFVLSEEQVERHAQYLMRRDPAYYAPNPRFQSDPRPMAAAF